MKLISLLILILFSILTVGQSKTERIVKIYKKGVGPVELNNGKGELSRETHYNSNGEIELDLSYNPGEILYSITKNTYNDQNRLLKSVELNYNSRNQTCDTIISKNQYRDTLLIQIEISYNGHLKHTKNYTYNEINQLILEQWNTPNGDIDLVWRTWEYDSLGNTIKKENLSPTGVVRQSMLYHYNESNVLVEEKHISHTSGGSSILSYTYDENQKKKQAKINSFNGEREILSYINYSYNEYGFLAREERTNDKDSVTYFIDYGTDSSGRKISLGNKSSKNFYTYNENGDLIRTQNISSKRDTFEIHNYKYESEKRIFEDFRRGNPPSKFYVHKDLTQKLSKYGLITSEQPTRTSNSGVSWIKQYSYNSLGQTTRSNHIYRPKIKDFFDLPPDIEGQRPKQQPLKDHITRYQYNSSHQLVSSQEPTENFKRLSRRANKPYLVEKNEDDFPFYETQSISKKDYKYIKSIDTIKVSKLDNGNLKIILKYSFEQTNKMKENGIKPFTNITRTEIKTHDGGYLSVKEKWKGLILYNYDENKKHEQLHYFLKYDDLKSNKYLCHRYGYELNAEFQFTSNKVIINMPLESKQNGITYYYFNNDKLNKEVWMISKKKQGETIVYNYNKKGQLNKSQHFSLFGRLRLTQTYYYKNDQLVKEYVVTERGEFSYIYQIK